jgi:hypothetical protein
MVGFERTGDALAAALGPAPTTPPGAWLGLEHEFVVRDRSGAPLDFRGLIPEIGLGHRHLDPADPNAHRLESGAVVTCDEVEAEIAIPPVPGTGSFPSRVVSAAEEARAALRHRLPRGARLEGWSTHLSLSLRGEAVHACAARYATTFAPALMLLMDRARSPGLLVRPRPGRLELCGEYVAGPALHAAVAFAAGSVRAVAAEVLGTGPSRVPRLTGRIRAADTRRGWYVDRRAFGDDLYATGRQTRLPLASGGWTSAQEQLERCWSVARAALTSSAAVPADDLVVTDEIVAGRLPLPSEGRITPRRYLVRVRSSAHGAALRVRLRPGFGVAPVMLTWGLAVFLVADLHRSRRAFASVPGDRLDAFLRLLDAGALDDLLAEHLRRPAGDRRLERREQAVEPGLYDELGPRLDLLAAEPGFAAGAVTELGMTWFRRAAGLVGQWATRAHVAAWPALDARRRASDA